MKPAPLIVTEVSGLNSETLPGVTVEIEACALADAVKFARIATMPNA